MKAPRLALVLAGGGARGAYEAGVLHYIRTRLPEPHRSARFPIITGSSVGAINAAFLAATADTPAQQGIRLRALWERIDQNRIFRRNWIAVGRFVAASTYGIAGNFIRSDPGRKSLPLARPFTALFDTKPLPKYLRELIPFQAIETNLAAGHLDALALTATSLRSDEPELFIQKRPEIAYRGAYTNHFTPIDIRHVMASAAIPFVFPAVNVNGTYYCDGGVKLNTPMSPAIQLGADRILVIGMHAAGETTPYENTGRAPGPGRLLAALNAAMFQDRVRYDFEQLVRINRIIRWSEKVYGDDYLDRINAYLSAADLHGDVADRGLKLIEALPIYPSRDISKVFEDLLHDNPYLDETFSSFERFAMRLLDVDPREGREVLSFLVFAPRYIRALLDLGFADAARHHDDLVAFFSGDPLPSPAPGLTPA